MQINGCQYHYEIFPGPPDSETIVFSHGLLWSGKMFSKQVEYLTSHYTCITYDHRGQGQTEITAEGYDIDSLYEDAVALIEKLVGKKPVIFVGLSMGGFIGMRVAARRSDLVSKLILLETSCEPEPAENIPRYKLLNNVVKWFGIYPVVGKVMPIMFGKKFLSEPSRKQDRRFWTEELKKNRPKGTTRAVDGVIHRKGVEHELPNISCPTLVIVGDQDTATVPAKSEKIHSLIKGSSLVVIPGAGHSSSVEEPELVNEAIGKFLGV